MFDTIRKSDVPKLKCSLFLVGSIIFLQLLVVSHNLNDFNRVNIIIFSLLFIIYIVSSISDYVFFKSYFLETNYAWLYMQLHYYFGNFVFVYLMICSVAEILYSNERLFIYSFIAHAIYMWVFISNKINAYMFIVLMAENTRKNKPCLNN